MTSIGIIGGTGSFGSNLAVALGRAGYKVIIGSRNKEKGEKRAEELSLKHLLSFKGGTNLDACSADIIWSTIPSDQIDVIFNPLISAFTGKILIESMVNIKFGKFIKAEFIENKSSYERIRDLIPEAKVVSTMKTFSASSLLNLPTTTELQDVFVMSLDDDAALEVEKIISNLGLRGIRIQGKAHSKTIEGMTALAIQLNKDYKGSHVGYKLVNLKTDE